MPVAPWATAVRAQKMKRNSFNRASPFTNYDRIELAVALASAKRSTGPGVLQHGGPKVGQWDVFLWSHAVPAVLESFESTSGEETGNKAIELKNKLHESICDSLVLEEALARDDGLDEIPESLVVAGHFLADLVDARAVAAVEFAADGVGEQLLGQAAGEDIVLRANQLSELGI